MQNVLYIDKDVSYNQDMNTTRDMFRSGDEVEFTTSRPGYEGQAVRGRVLWSCDESSACIGLDVIAPWGRHQVMPSNATKVASGVRYLYR